MHFETALNVVWLAFGLCALASTARFVIRSERDARRGPAWLHIVGVALIVAALFPYISATDDILRVEHFNAQHDQRHPGKQNRTDDLMRLYETMDTPLVCRTTEIAMTLFFVALVFTPALRAIDRIAPFEAGRSPPFAA